MNEKMLIYHTIPDVASDLDSVLNDLSDHLGAVYRAGHRVVRIERERDGGPRRQIHLVVDTTPISTETEETEQ